MFWITEGEEKLLEMYELLTEARDQVDRKYPRNGNVQTDAIVQRFGLGRWLDAHSLMFDIEREIKA